MLKIRSAQFQAWGVALALAVCLASEAGCAKIGEPQPPQVRIPKPAADLAARQSSDSVLLTVSKPAQNTNGTPATTLQKVEVLRLVEDAEEGGKAAPLPEDQFLKRAVPILLIPANRFPSYLQGQAFGIQDHFLMSPQGSAPYFRVLRYAVRFINNRNQTAGLSNQVRITPVPIPPPPEGLSAQVTEDAVKLKWLEPSENMDGSKPPRIAGYNIYRSEEPGKLPPVPINHDPVQGPEFEDRTFQFDRTYYYGVSTVGSLQNPYAESLISKTFQVACLDLFPPAPPRDFTALFEGGSVILLWSPSSSADTAGYRLYRQEKGSTVRQLLQSELITVLSYRDKDVEPGKGYVYSLQAVDTHGNVGNEVQTEVETR